MRAGGRGPALTALRDRVAQAYGPRFSAGRDEPDPTRAARAGSRGPGFSDRYRDGITALWPSRSSETPALSRAGQLCWRRRRMGPPSSPPGSSAIATLSDALEASLIRLLHSSRPDWGSPPRRHGPSRRARPEPRGRAAGSSSTPSPGTPVVIPPQEVARRPSDDARAPRGGDRRLRDQPRPAWAPAPGDTEGFRKPRSRPSRPPAIACSRSRAPSAAGAPAHAPRTGRAVAGAPSGLLVPAVDTGRSPTPPLEQGNARRHDAKLRDLYGYNVVTRNCVTEIFRTIDAALVLGRPTGAEAREESVRRLGGHVEVEGRSASFRPRRRRGPRRLYRLGDHRAPVLPPRGAGADVSPGEPPPRLSAESNTLTSTLYQRNPDDSAFLFFTDDALPLAPSRALSIS